jgi:hypothetical protein
MLARECGCCISTRGLSHAIVAVASQVIQAAVLDVLTTQCDRHTENVFVTREGQLQVGSDEASW